MTDTLKNVTNGLGSYVALVVMIALAVTGSSVVFTLFSSIVLGWMTSHVAYYSYRALNMMYIVALALHDVMPGDKNHPANLYEFDAYLAYVYDKALKK